MPKFKTAAITVAIFLAFVLFCPLQKAQAQENPQIAVFFLQKVMEDSKQGKAAAKKLEDKYAGYKKTLDAKTKTLQNKGQELEKSMATLSEDAFTKRRDELAKEFNALREETEKAGVDMEKAREETMAPIMRKVTDEVANLAKSRGFQYVFEVQNAGVFYFPQGADITNDLIKAVDN
jgi:outer membrane protein